MQLSYQAQNPGALTLNPKSKTPDPKSKTHYPNPQPSTLNPIAYLNLNILNPEPPNQKVANQEHASRELTNQESVVYAATALGNLAATHQLQASILRAAPEVLLDLTRALTLDDVESRAGSRGTTASLAATPYVAVDASAAPRGQSAPARSGLDVITVAVTAAGATQMLLEAPGAWALNGDEGGDGTISLAISGCQPISGGEGGGDSVLVTLVDRLLAGIVHGLRRSESPTTKRPAVNPDQSGGHGTESDQLGTDQPECDQSGGGGGDMTSNLHLAVQRRQTEVLAVTCAGALANLCQSPTAATAACARPGCLAALIALARRAVHPADASLWSSGPATTAAHRPAGANLAQYSLSAEASSARGAAVRALFHLLQLGAEVGGNGTETEGAGEGGGWGRVDERGGGDSTGGAGHVPEGFTPQHLQPYSQSASYAGDNLVGGPTAGAGAGSIGTTLAAVIHAFAGRAPSANASATTTAAAAADLSVSAEDMEELAALVAAVRGVVGDVSGGASVTDGCGGWESDQPGGGVDRAAVLLLARVEAVMAAAALA